jgi:transposase
MSTVDQLGAMSAEELRAFAASLIDQVARLSTDIRLKQFKIDQLTHEMAILKRWKFGGRSEQLAGEQKTLFDETLDADLAAIEVELDALRGAPAA